MKIVLKENRTIPVNPDLLLTVTGQYIQYFTAYQDIMIGNVNPRRSKAYEELQQLGGKAYFKGLVGDNAIHFIWRNKPLSSVMDYDSDTILRRRLKLSGDDEFSRVLSEMPNSVITLAFWIHDPNDETADLGTFEENLQTEDASYKNAISIRFPSLLAIGRKGNWPQLESTIRHECQHFTQSFYAKLLGSKKWIGLPSLHTVKGKDPFDNTGKHQDIPVEIATDVQDEIDDFLRDARLMNLAEIKPAFLEYVGVTDTGKYIDSDVFKHYLETNKEIWKWAVGKLLASVSKL